MTSQSKCQSNGLLTVATTVDRHDISLKKHALLQIKTLFLISKLVIQTLSGEKVVLDLLVGSQVVLKKLLLKQTAGQASLSGYNK